MMSKMDKVFKKVLNDEKIFFRKKIIFNHEEWKNIGESYRNGEIEGYNRIITSKIQEAHNNHDKKVISYCQGLQNSMKNKSNILDQMFVFLDDFSIIISNLPESSSMDNFGTVIERYNQPIVEEYFLDKIKKEYNPKYNNYSYRGKALIKVLEYVKELYNSNVSSEEISYFVRKLNSLTTYWEILK